jgi:hypothetical protein
VNGSAAVELVVFITTLRRRLVGIVSRGLVAAVVTSRGARRVCGGILLPLRIHDTDWLLLLWKLVKQLRATASGVAAMRSRQLVVSSEMVEALAVTSGVGSAWLSGVDDDVDGRLYPNDGGRDVGLRSKKK